MVAFSCATLHLLLPLKQALRFLWKGGWATLIRTKHVILSAQRKLHGLLGFLMEIELRKKKGAREGAPSCGPNAIRQNKIKVLPNLAWWIFTALFLYPFGRGKALQRRTGRPGAGLLLWDGGRALGQTLLLSGPPQNWEVGDRGRLAFLGRWGIHGRGNLAFLLRGNRLCREFGGAVSPAPTIDWQWPTGSTRRYSRASDREAFVGSVR